MLSFINVTGFNKPGFHAQNSRICFSPSHDSCAKSSGTESYPGSFCCGEACEMFMSA